MKRAASIDLRRKIIKRNKKNCPIFRSIKIEGLPGFGRIELKPQSGLLAFCGGSGVGKSSVLRALALALCAFDDPVLAYDDPRLGSFKASIVVEHGEDVFCREIQVGVSDTGPREGFKPEIKLVTLYHRTEDLLLAFENDKSANIVAPYEPKSFTQEQLNLASRALGKKYEEVLVYEIEDEDNEESILPFFAVKEGGISYDCKNMGTGELSVVYITWLMDYIQEGSILLMEEPEAMIPPSGQIAVYDIICAGAMKKSAAVILSTHSTEIVAQVPVAHLYPLTRLNGVTSCVTTANNKNNTLSALGLRVSKNIIVFVEDELALYVAAELIARYDLHLIRRVEFADMKTGFGAIRTAVTRFPAVKSFSIVGMLDGDMREEAAQWERRNLCCFLPFSTTMEHQFLQAVNKDVAGYAAAVRRSLPDVEAALAKAAGQEDHDAFHDFKNTISLSNEQVAKFCVDHWIMTEQTENLCQDFIVSFRSLVR